MKTERQIGRATPLEQLFAGIELNDRLVKARLWHKRFVDMTTDAELEAYALFVFALNDSRAMALKLEKK